MSEIILNFKKEYNNFLKRDYMKKWLLKLFILAILFTFFNLGTLEPCTSILNSLSVPEHLRGTVFNLFLVAFLVLLIPNNATLDTILGEKKNKTMETLMTTPMSIINIFFGKMLFIMFLVFSQFILYIVSANLVMYFAHGYSFFTFIDGSIVIVYFISIACSIIVCTLLGVVLSLINNNVKAIGYLNMFVGLILLLMSLKYVSIQIDVNGLLTVIFIQILMIISLSVFLGKHIKKSTVMKYVKW